MNLEYINAEIKLLKSLKETPESLRNDSVIKKLNLLHEHLISCEKQGCSICSLYIKFETDNQDEIEKIFEEYLKITKL